MTQVFWGGRCLGEEGAVGGESLAEVGEGGVGVSGGVMLLLWRRTSAARSWDKWTSTKR